jgi:hypothetical protein
MDETLRAMIAQIHAAPRQLCLALTGAGSQALAWLLAVPGGSRTLLEALVPYSRTALDAYLGFEPAQYAAPSTALALAARAARRAYELGGDPEASAGLACAAAIATEPPRRGSHRAAIARWDRHAYVIYQLTMAKGRRSREQEEALVSQLVLRATAEAVGLDGKQLCQPDPDEQLEIQVVPLRARLQTLLAGEAELLLLDTQGRLRGEAGDVRVVLPGSFNPLHQGHRELAQVAAYLTGAPICFEIAARNADKPSLPAPLLMDRLSQFAGWADVAITAAPLFVEKARLFPGSTFVIGADTAARLVQAHYYGGEQPMLAAFATIRAQGCRFLVAGRLAKGQFRTLDDLPIPESLADLLSAIPPELFRADISSTQLREQASRAA